MRRSDVHAFSLPDHTRSSDHIWLVARPSTFADATILKGPARARISSMKNKIRQGIWTLAIALSLGIGAGAVQAQEQGPDYSRNKTYQQGMREGRTDQTHHRDHYKKHHFKKDEDQKAYEAGYQKGHGN
jgi:hypothetical protein